MPKKQQVSKEMILRAALDTVCEKGPGALGARAVARKLGVSTQPIFSQFASTGELEQAVYREAVAVYNRRVETAMQSSDRPYRAAGLAYIAFAREEPKLFRWLFMRDRSKNPADDPTELEPFLAILQKTLGLSREDALLFYLEMWTVVHGIATMIATSYFDWNQETVSRVLTDFYQGLQSRFQKEDIEK